jgi:ABC-2 type transport system permease protein
VILPLLFISDVFIPSQEGAEWLTTVADIFPVRHFSLALQTAFNPSETGAGFEWSHLGVMAAWAIVGLLVAVRTYSWEPGR